YVLSKPCDLPATEYCPQKRRWCRLGRLKTRRFPRQHNRLLGAVPRMHHRAVVLDRRSGTERELLQLVSGCDAAVSSLWWRPRLRYHLDPRGIVSPGAVEHRGSVLRSIRLGQMRQWPHVLRSHKHLEFRTVGEPP